ncbi:hypothetical protein CAEBREN_22631 [Caenorhabditis brenneri]|uniref:Uncharacterized protein n=1 Tax=Caenorhabditis brenneri TaxID=135651 RepID=G0NS37_CAEBE|nr:hypothetical protein CAEBREN_22631 [Caenorhabditis brenneri]
MKEDRTLQHDFTAKDPKMVWLSRLNSSSLPIQIKVIMTIDDSFKKFDVPDQFSDMCLEVGTEKSHVAKWLLINQSARFKRMFEQGDLNEIKECEDFLREKSKRSIKDMTGKRLRDDRSEGTFRPKSSVKTETKKHQVQDTEDGNEEDDVDEMSLNRRNGVFQIHFWSTGGMYNEDATEQQSENHALKWKIQQLEIQNQQLQAAQAGRPMSPTSVENAQKADKERIRILENENRRLDQELAKYQLNPENLDLTSFIYNEGRDVAGHPKIVQLTTRTEHLYNVYKNQAIPSFKALDNEEKEKWSKVWRKMRGDQKKQLAMNLIQYVKKEVIERSSSSSPTSLRSPSGKRTVADCSSGRNSSSSLSSLRVENLRINQAAEVNRIRDKMETLRRDNAENLKNVRQHYVARVGGKTQKINALHRQRASDAQRHFAEVARVQVQLVAQNACLKAGEGIRVNISDIHREARQLLDEALRNGENARNVLDLQTGF